MNPRDPDPALLCAACHRGAHRECDHARGGDSACRCVCSEPTQPRLAKTVPAPLTVCGRPVTHELLDWFAAVLRDCKARGISPRLWLMEAEEQLRSDALASRRD